MDWTPYFDKTTGLPPRELYLEAVERFSGPGLAVDLGFGAGNETMDLLSRGWEVVAVDADPAAAPRLHARADGAGAERLTTVTGTIEDFDMPRADLVHAGSSVFFVPAARFTETWDRIVASLRPGGRFAGNLLGERDDWAANPAMTPVSRSTLDEMLAGLEVEHLHEQDEDGRSMQGPKHWHAYHVVARKP
ncbi:methyltransferase family protein [Stackebrandtia albiflava]|uniref:Methyltransferase family protein n=1 Tax=Stackebrandtia albiflava TaxID=406432 RepID=A0A562VEL9_9ACTN|nr:methyltransferase domain-containing protein [Stackebrandtia albiflava]TWJ16336.1 methyltransferase family protein [Stackebrandtia albiflava]